MKLKNIGILVMSGLIGLSVMACGNTNSSKTGKEVELKLPTYLAGENVGAKFFLPQVERFNKKYEGKYKIVVEEVPQDAYAEKDRKSVV